MRWVVYFILAVIGLMGLNAFIDSRRETFRVHVGRYVFDVPREHAWRQSTPFWLWFVTTDRSTDGREELAVIPIEQFQERFPEFVPVGLEQRIIILIKMLTPREIEFYKRGNEWIAELWFRRGDFADQVIEPLPGSEFVRVFQRPDRRGFWQVFREPPDPTKPFPEDIRHHQVASCHSTYVPGSSRNSRNDCLVVLRRGDLYVDFSVAEENLISVDEISDFVFSIIDSWQVRD
jgi:hypothetical protein